MIWLLIHGPGSADIREKSFDELFPYIELKIPGVVDGYQDVQKLPDPRLIKTHLAAKFFQRQLQQNETCPRIIVVLRQPLDVLVSFYHFHKMWVSLTHWGRDKMDAISQTTY